MVESSWCPVLYMPDYTLCLVTRLSYRHIIPVPDRRHGYLASPWKITWSVIGWFPGRVVSVARDQTNNYVLVPCSSLNKLIPGGVVTRANTGAD